MEIAVNQLNVGRASTFGSLQSWKTYPLRDRADWELYENLEGLLQYFALLHEIAYSNTLHFVWTPVEKKETQTRLFNISNAGDIGSGSFNVHIDPNLYFEWSLRRNLLKTEEELEHGALFAVSSTFSQIDKVRSIYFQRYKGELQF